jgi:uncharacterized protein (TIGR02757 family)
MTLGKKTNSANARRVSNSHKKHLLNNQKQHLLILQTHLDEINKRFELCDEIENDPVFLAKKFTDPADQEVVAFIASAFSYGNVKQIMNSVRWVLEIIASKDTYENSPFKTLLNTSGFEWKEHIPKNFKHRFNTADDLGLFLTWIGEALRRYGSLENLFSENISLNTSATQTLPSLERRLSIFIKKLTSLPSTPYKKPKSKGALFFVPSPEQGSACKRMFLFLRWVVGSGNMNLNLWKSIHTQDLIIPVDTHVLRISQNLGLTKRKTGDWKSALEITEKLKIIAPKDPTSYDFALCHIGISQMCPSRFNKKVCQSCQMNSLCIRFRSGATGPRDPTTKQRI